MSEIDAMVTKDVVGGNSQSLHQHISSPTSMSPFHLHHKLSVSPIRADYNHPASFELITCRLFPDKIYYARFIKAIEVQRYKL